uniref:Uncharacterized protein n=1 Tax=Caenorhabditis japonica TaxID=281687 RepID=A0A8R1E8Y1_CAEJA
MSIHVTSFITMRQCYLYIFNSFYSVTVLFRNNTPKKACAIQKMLHSREKLDRQSEKKEIPRMYPNHVPVCEWV